MKYTVFLFFSLFIFASCDSNSKNEKKKYLPPSSGTHAEMLLVVEEPLWTSRTGQALIDVFGQEQYGLPQPEGIFSLNRIAPSQFQGLLKRTKSMVFVERSDTTLIETKRNVWATPQLITTITAPTEKEIIDLLERNKEVLVDVHHKGDVLTVQTRMKEMAYKTLPESIKSLGIEKMLLELGFSQTLDKPEIKIFRQNTKKTTQFLIFSTRSGSDDQLVGQDIVAARDSIGKHYFEGSVSGSYFATETIIPPQQIHTEIDGEFAIETRGMWKTVGDFMGGPFISYTIYRDNSDEILTIEGVVYGPDAKKRNTILEMEAMVKSIQFAK